MKTLEEIKQKIKSLQENKNLTNCTKNFYWEQALEWVIKNDNNK